MDPSSENHPIFDNHLLLDTILDYVILGQGDVATSQVKKCRSVNKTWLRSINRVLQKSQNPLFIFNLGEQECRLCDRRNGEVIRISRITQHNELAQFMESVAKKLYLELDDSVPLYSIRNSGFGSQPNSSWLLFESLTNCGSGLIALEVLLSEGKVPFLPNRNFFLPKLNKFTVKLSRESVSGRKDINIMQNEIDFMKLVIDAAQQLKSLELAYSDIRDNFVPASFGNLLLPSSITRLYLMPPLTECHLQTLINSCLPNLTILHLRISKPAVENRLISSILKKIQKTLQHLYLSYESEHKVNDITTYQLPLMEKLKILNITNMYPSLQLAEQGSSFQQIVPVLTHLNLYERSNASWKMFRNWAGAGSLHLPSVKSLLLFQMLTPIRLANMQVLHKSLPSLKDLWICSNMTVLIFIMKEMKNLRRLKFTYKESGQLERSDSWDAVLTGVPQESVDALRASPELWDALQIESDVSLRNLTELNLLELYAAETNFSGFSEMAFRYAFLKMPKLNKLILGGGFRTTREMARIWVAEGRFIKTYLDEGGVDENGLEDN